MKTKTLIASLIISVFCASSFSHQDRIFSLEGDTLEGLPEQYHPASFSYETKQLRVENNSIIIPQSIWVQFGDTTEDPLFFSGSWYHAIYKTLFGPDESLPPYMSIRNSSFDLLINLDTLELVDVSWNPELTANQLQQWNSSLVWGEGNPKPKTKDRPKSILISWTDIVILSIPVIGLILFIIIRIIRKKKNPNQSVNSITASGGSE